MKVRINLLTKIQHLKIFWIRLKYLKLKLKVFLSQNQKKKFIKKKKMKKITKINKKLMSYLRMYLFTKYFI